MITSMHSIYTVTNVQCPTYAHSSAIPTPCIPGPFPINPSDTMAEKRPTTTDPYFVTRNIMNNSNDLEDIILLPTQATTHERDGLDLLVCPPLPRAGEAEMRLHQAHMVYGRVHTIHPNNEEGSEMVCGGMDMTHRTSDRIKHNSEVGIGFGVMDTHEHTTLHYIPQQVPQPEITTHNTPAAFTSNFTYQDQIEEGESIPNSWLTIQALENPPPTQEFVSGRITKTYCSND